MSLSLKHIPCPAGLGCTAFLCIFGHPGEESQAADDVPKLAATQSEVAPAPTGKRPSEDTSSQPSRKRSKQETLTPSTKPSENGQPASKINSVTRPISPPASKRSKNDAKAGTPKQLPSVESDSKRKPESLNPRLLKSSPSSHETRLKLVWLLHAEYARLNTALKSSNNAKDKKLIMSDQGVVTMALDFEQATAVSKAAVYTNVMKNCIMQYKRMTVDQWRDEQTKKAPGPLPSEMPKVVKTGLTASEEVRFLQHLLTPVDDLSNHGYVSKVPSEEAIQKAREGLEAAMGYEKCDRCLQRFQVFPGRRESDGALTSGGPCRFHWGKAYVPAKAPGDTTRVPKRYRCCGQEVGGSEGCATHDTHVFKVNDAKRLAALWNFAETPDNAHVSAEQAVCFDCEMAYTVHGMELIRLTATTWPSGEEILDVLVQPVGEILDLNSRYSGVWPEDMAHATPWAPGDDTKPGTGDSKKIKKVSSPEVARSLLFSLISPTTPLIGHGLENDLNAARIVHPTLIDTVLLFPHRAGLPIRHALKVLMDTHLNRKIQQETGRGHDSAEDARAAGELVRLKVMQKWTDMQRAGWTLREGDFVLPSNGADGTLTTEFLETSTLHA